MTAQMTPALTELEKRKKKLPPRYPVNSKGADRAEALTGVLKLPPEIQRRMADKAVVVGEVGDVLPDARTYELGRESFLVVLTSGMMDFLYAVARSMAGATVVYSSSGEATNVQALNPGEIAALTATVFKQWRQHCEPNWLSLFQRQKRIEFSSFSLAERARAPAEAMATCAEMFILAHEFGHVALDLGLVKPPVPNIELSADILALNSYFPAAGEQLGPRMAMTGASFAIRVMDGLSRSGAKFSREYPPASERLQTFLDVMRSACPSERLFDELSTVMVANLDLMDDIDERIGSIDVQARAMRNPWQTQVRLMAVLEALIMQGRPRSEFLHLFKRATETTPEADMRKIADTLLRYFPLDPQEPAYLPPDVRVRIAQELRGSIVEMEPSQKAFFDDNPSL